MNRSRTPLLLLLLLVLATGVGLVGRRLGGSPALAGGPGGGVRSAAGPDGEAPLEPLHATAEGGGAGRRVLEVEALPAAVPADGADGVDALPADATRLTGTVVRPGGAPVPGARVVASPAEGWFLPPADLEPESAGRPARRFEATTDGDGRFVLGDVPPGRLSLAIHADGLAPLRRGAVEVPEHREHDLGTFALELGVVLAGRVTGARGAGIEGVRVLAAVSRRGGFSRVELPGRGIPVATTDAEGRFEASSVAPGGWHLLFDHPGHRVAELDGVTEPAGASDRALLVQLDPGLTIEGRVEGLALTGADGLRVTARVADEQPTTAAESLGEAERGRPRSAQLGPDGDFVVPGLADGVRYRLRLERLRREGGEGGEGPETWGAVPGAPRVDAQAGDRGVRIEVIREALVRFSVRDAKSGAPVESLLVDLRGEGLQGGPGEDGPSGEPEQRPGGVVELTGLRPAVAGSELTLRVRSSGHRDLEREGLLLRPGQELDLGVLELSPAPRGTVRVVDDGTGEPVEGAEVLVARGQEAEQLVHIERFELRWLRHHPGFRSATSDASGVARPTLWENTVAAVRARAEGYRPSEEARLVPPFDGTVELRLRRGGSVTVRVVDEEGEPVPGMTVRRTSDGEPEEWNRFRPADGGGQRTSEDGALRFENLAEGRHRFTAVERPDPWGEPDPAGPGATEEVVVRHGAELDIELRVPIRGGLGVTILEGGRPLAGALVKLEPVDEEAGQAWWWGGQEDPRSRISDHAGRARFSGLEVGAWWLLVSHPARRMVAAREVRVERSPRELRIELGVATIEARLVDAEGEPVEGVDVRVVTAGDERLDRVMNDYRMRLSEDQDGYPSYDYEEVAPPRVRSDDEGRFRLRGVAPEVPLRVQLTGTYVVRREVEVGPLGPDERWGPEEIQVERAGALRVRLEGVDRERLGSYRARLRGADGAVEERRFRSWRGEARFDSLPPGPWTLELHEKGIEEPLDTREVEVRAARTERVALRP